MIVWIKVVLGNSETSFEYVFNVELIKCMVWKDIEDLVIVNRNDCFVVKG